MKVFNKLFVFFVSCFSSPGASVGSFLPGLPRPKELNIQSDN